jgi:hypothetical protein
VNATLPTFDTVALVGGGNVLHVIEPQSIEVVEPTSLDAGGHDGRAVCGAAGRLRNMEHEIDARAIRHEGRPVCGNCRSQVERSPVRGVAAGTIREHAATEKPRRRREETTMAKGAKAKIDKLRAERTSINNKLSGLNTQLKRIAGTPREKARKPEINKRIKELTSRRDAIGAELDKLEEDAGASAAASPRRAAAHSSTRATAKGRRRVKTTA